MTLLGTRALAVMIEQLAADKRPLLRAWGAGAHLPALIDLEEVTERRGSKWGDISQEVMPRNRA